MKIAIGSDHGGFRVKNEIVRTLSHLGHQVMDLGCYVEESCDYPDYAKKVATIVSKKKAGRGILVCGTGIGMCIAANKVPNIRAAVCWSPKSAALASEHNNANVLCISGRLIPLSVTKKIVKSWLNTPFAGGRHLRRTKKISKIEKK